MADTFDFLIEDEDDPFDDEHHSDRVFPELDDDDRPKAIEWEKPHSTIRLLCGCYV